MSELELLVQQQNRLRRQQVEEVVGYLPEENKAAYFEALRVAPQLVERESPVELFLRREDGDVWAAATRLATYWDSRRNIFGAARAFLPLAMTNSLLGRGVPTSSPSHIATTIAPTDSGTQSFLQSGLLTQLPDDMQGCSVFFFDRSKLGVVDTSESSVNWKAQMLPSLFYWCHVALQNERSVIDGVVGISFDSLIASDLQHRLDAKQALDLIQDAFPIRVKSVHVCFLACKDKMSSLRTFVIPGISHRFSKYSSIPLHVHVVGSCEADLASRLLPHGLSLEGLPYTLGGRWVGGGNSNGSSFFLNWSPTLRPSLAAAAAGRLASPPVESNTTATNALLLALGSGLAQNPGLLDHRSEMGMHTPSRKVSASPPAGIKNSPKQVTVASTNASTMTHPVAVAAPAATAMQQRQQVFGFVETTAIQHEGLKRLDEAMDMLPYDHKIAYLAALRRAPYLVQTESSPIRFLRREKYDAWAAARRLAAYWRFRLEAFGHDRAFLPMSITGEGALNQEDIDAMHCGYINFLPNDGQGRPVVCYDPERRRHHSPGTRMRCLFYFCDVASECDIAQTAGCVAIVLLGQSSASGSRLDRALKTCVDIFFEALPVQFATIHLVNCPSGIGYRIFLEVLVPVMFLMMSTLVTTMKDRIMIHVGDKAELLRKLSSHGFQPSGLPDAIGGTRTFLDHVKWLQERRQLEMAKRMYMALSPLQLPSMEVGSSSQNSNSAPSEGLLRSLSSTDRTSALSALSKAMDCIEPSDKALYLQALEKAPDLVKKESDPFRFLRYENFNAPAAARRLCQYWQVRSRIFGDRMFLPLDQTGEGALDRRDIVILGTTYLLSLPSDSNGRAVLFCDGTRLTKSSRESRLRCSFYMYSIAAENDLSQTDGFILLYIVTEPSFDRANQECLDMVLSAVPASVLDIHLMRYPEGNNDTFLENIEPSVLQQFRELAKNEVVEHPARTRSSLAKSLAAYGLAPGGLPKSIGGTFGFDKYVQWQELRMRYEWNLPAGVSNKEEANMFDFSKAKNVSEMTEEEKVERKRKLNVIHSRRKRERERVEVEVLNEQCSEQQEHQTELVEENKRLYALLAQAQSIVSKHIRT